MNPIYEFTGYIGKTRVYRMAPNILARRAFIRELLKFEV